MPKDLFKKTVKNRDGFAKQAREEILYNYWVDQWIKKHEKRKREEEKTQKGSFRCGEQGKVGRNARRGYLDSGTIWLLERGGISAGFSCGHVGKLAAREA
jgi:hypothetical protein